MIKFDSNILRNRISLVNEYLSHLKEMQNLSETEYLADFRNYNTVERLLQLTIEAFIDVGNHLVAVNTWGKPSNYREIFQILTEQGILTEDLGKKSQDIIGFRNILVHHYFRLDRELVYKILQDDLDDLASLARHIIHRLGLSEMK